MFACNLARSHSNLENDNVTPLCLYGGDFSFHGVQHCASKKKAST